MAISRGTRLEAPFFSLLTMTTTDPSRGTATASVPAGAVADDLVATLRERLGLDRMIGCSGKFMEAVRRVREAARNDIAVLITGETGTGKEVCARAVHYLGRRAGRRFVPVNCGALPADLVENELFGHAAGAYTGATRSSEGLVQEADGGTLFLDEIDSLPLAAQVKLLRFLQEKEYRPVGSQKVRRSDVRVLAASNSDLRRSVEAGRFRADLYYRLNVLWIHLPPLRERTDDLPLLARHFIQRFSTELGERERALSPCALARLAAHDWSGNVRELENVIHRAVVHARGSQIEAGDLEIDTGPPTESTPPVRSDSPVSESFQVLKSRVIAEFERNYLTQLLRTKHGNIAQAAKAAGKNRRAFWELLRKHGLNARPATAAPQ